MPSPATLDDRELLADFLASGSQEAFAAIVDRHHAWVVALCRRVLGDHHDAEDAAQATFIALAQKAATLQVRTSLSAWLHVAAITAARGVRRAATRRIRHERKAAEDRALEVTPSNGSALVASPGLLDESMAQLPVEQREAIILRYLRGMSENEAAELQGCPVRTLHNRVARGMERLRELLRHRGEEALASCVPATLASIASATAKAGVVASATTAATAAAALGQGVPHAIKALRRLPRPQPGPWSGLGAGLGGLALAAGVAAAVLLLHPASPASTVAAAPAVAPAPEAPSTPTAAVPASVTAAPAVAAAAPSTLSGHTGAITGLVLDGAGSLLSTAWDRTLRRWSLDGGRLLSTTPVPGEGARQLAIAPDGGWVALACADHQVHLLELASGVQQQLRGHLDEVTSVAFSPDGHWIASTGKDRTTRLWNRATLEQMACWTSPDLLWGVAFSPDSRHVVAVGDDQQVFLAHAVEAAGADIAFSGYHGVLRTAVYSADGRLLATCGDEGLVRVWDASSGACLQQLSQPGPISWGLAFSHDGRYLAAGALDGHLQLWSTASWVSVADWQGGAGSGECLVFSLDGSELLSAGGDQLIHRWPLAQMQAQAQKPAPEPSPGH